MNFKALIAAAAVTVGTWGAAPMPAEAAASNCWIVPTSGYRVDPFRCDVSERTNANGHTVYDIRHFQGAGAHFSVILWTVRGVPTTAEVFIDGERYITDWYYDEDGDVRLDLGPSGEFVF